MPFRSLKTSKQYVQDASPQRARGRISNSKGKSPAPTQTINSSASPSNAARLSRNASKLTSEAAGSGSVRGLHSMEQFGKGTPAGRVTANRTAGGGGKLTTESVTSVRQGRSPAAAARRGGPSPSSGLESPRGNPSRKSRSVSVGIRYRADSSDEEWPGSSSVKGRGQALRQTSGISMVTRNHSKSLQQPAQSEERRTKGSSAAGRLNTAASSSLPAGPREKSRGRNGQRQSVTQTQPSTEQVVPLKRSGKRKNSDRTYTAQNQSLSHNSSSALHSPEVEPPSKRTRFSDGQTTGEVSQMPRGKKSLLRRAREDMLVSSSTATNKSSSKTTAVKSKTSLSETSDLSKPLTRHSVHTVSSTRSQNSRFPGRGRRPGWSWTENGAAHPELHESGSATNPVSEMPTTGRKKGAVKMDGAAYNPGNGLSPSQTKVRRTESRGAVQMAGPSGISGGSVKGLHHTHVHGAGGRKAGGTGQQNEVDTARLPVAARLRTPTTKQCERGKGTYCAQNHDRPRRSLSKRKKCECCEHDSEHSDSSLSDAELPRKAGKDEDRAWRSSIRSSRPKLKAKRSQFSSSKNVRSNVSSQTQVITYMKYPAYPVKLHTSSFAQELPLHGAAPDCGKEEVKMEESQTPDSGVKDEAESPSKSELTTFNQDAKQPGDIALVHEDFYVVVADSDDEEETTEMLAKDMSADDMKPELKNIVIGPKEEPDFKTDSGLHSAASLQKEDEKQAPATMTSSQEEVRALQAEPTTGTSVSAQREENEPATVQSNSLHSQGEQIPSATAQNAQLYLKSGETGLTLEEKESHLQSVETSSSEVTVSSDRKETESEMQQDLSEETLTAQQEGCRHTERNFETTVTAQTPGIVNSEKDQTETVNIALKTSARGDTALDADIPLRCDQAQGNTAGLSTGEETEQAHHNSLEAGFTNTTDLVQGGLTAAGPVEDSADEGTEVATTLGEVPDRNGAAEGSTVEQKTNQGGQATKSDRGEDSADAAISEKDPSQENGGGREVRPAEDSQVANFRHGLTEQVIREETHQVGSSVEDSMMVNMDEKYAEGKSMPLETSAKTPVQDGDVNTSPAENSVQAEVGVLPTHNRPDQTCDTSCEDKEALEQLASRHTVLQQSSSTALGGDEVQSSLNIGGSENSEAGGLDFVAARNMLQENNVSKDRQCDPVQPARAEEAMLNSDQTATKPLEHEKCSEGFPQIQETCDNRLGQGAGEVACPAAVGTFHMPDETDARLHMAEQCLNSEESEVPRTTNDWPVRLPGSVMNVVRNKRTVQRLGQNVTVAPELGGVIENSAHGGGAPELVQEQSHMVTHGEEGADVNQLPTCHAALDTVGAPEQAHRISFVGEPQGQNHAQKLTADSSFSGLNLLGKTAGDENKNPGPFCEDRVPF